MTQQSLPPLDEYIEREECRQLMAKHFPSEQSFRWQIRRLHAQLAESGAMIKVAGRLKFHPVLTERIVVEAGRINAAEDGTP